MLNEERRQCADSHPMLPAAAALTSEGDDAMAGATRERSQAGIVQLTYDRSADTLFVRLREAHVMDHEEDVGADRRVLYAGSAPVGLEFRNVHRGISTDNLPETVTPFAVAAASFVRVLLDWNDATSEPASAEGDEENERLAWSRLGLRALARDWDSEADRIYDQLR